MIYMNCSEFITTPIYLLINEKKVGEGEKLRNQKKGEFLLPLFFSQVDASV